MASVDLRVTPVSSMTKPHSAWAVPGIDCCDLQGRKINLKNWTTLVGRPVSQVTLSRSRGFFSFCFFHLFFRLTFLFMFFHLFFDCPAHDARPGKSENKKNTKNTHTHKKQKKKTKKKKTKSKEKKRGLKGVPRETAQKSKKCYKKSCSS